MSRRTTAEGRRPLKTERQLTTEGTEGTEGKKKGTLQRSVSLALETGRQDAKNLSDKACIPWAFNLASWRPIPWE
jgi:hypothetical protein